MEKHQSLKGKGHKALSKLIAPALDLRKKQIAAWMELQSGKLSLRAQKIVFIVLTFCCSVCFLLLITKSLLPQQPVAFGNISKPTLPKDSSSLRTNKLLPNPRK